MNKERFGFVLPVVLCGAVLCGALLIGAQQNPTPPAAPQGGRGQGPPGGGRGGRGGRPPGRKVVLAWADTRNGIAQHDSVSHALATIERLGYESGLWDTYIRTDSNIASYHPLMTTGQAASGGPSFNNVDAIFFMGHREVAIDDQQKADLLKFVHDEGKGFVAAHVGLTALMAWPEFGEMLGGQFQDHPYGSVAGSVINEDPSFPATRHLPALFNLTDEFYQVKGFSREKSRVLLRLDTSKLPPNQNLLSKDGDFPLAWAKMYGQGRVFYGSFAHDAKTWDNPDVYHMYFEAIRWALKLTDADVTPRPLPASAPAAANDPSRLLMAYDGTMPLQSSAAELGKDFDVKVGEQLKRILASKAFRQADRLKRFLTFIVEETLAGRGERLKEFVVGVEVFGKPESFDPRNDPIVRVQARRLRTQLARYYREEGPEGELLIELPKGGYAPVFRPLKSVAVRRTMSPTLVSRNTVVVLPFADHSPAGDQEYFCQGLSQEIIHTLAGTEAIRLVAWNEGAPAGTQMAMKEAAERLNAALIVTGSVRKAGKEARITINLVDAASGCYLWSGAVDRTLDNIIAVQEEVAHTVAEQLKRELLGGAQSRSVRRPTENLAAYNLYVQGRYHLNQRSEEGLRKAVEFFEKAIVENAQYAQAYSGLSDAYGLLGHYGVLAPAEVWTKAASNAAWAVLQDENSAEAHTSFAHVKSTQDWDWLGAEREFQRALALDPRYPTAHHWYAMSCLAPLGRLDQACEEMMLAQALDPISSIIGRDLARICYYKQDYEAALEQCDHTIELNPHFSPAYWILGLVQEQRGELDESAAAFQRAIQLSPRSPLMQAALGRTFALSGKQSEALRILRELRDLAEKRYVSPFDLASIHFALGQSDEGFQWLAKAFQDRCFELISLRVDPRWESLRGNPRFHKLFDQLGLP